jgi:hypothetical protein
MLALWCLVELTPWGWFVPMAISAVGNGLSQLPGCSGRRLPHDSALAMVAVVVASLALALVIGLLALRRSGAPLRAARPARLRADPKAYCVRRGVAIAGYGADRDGEQRFGRRIYRRESNSYPSDLRDARWARLAPLIPEGSPGGRPRKTDMRAAMNAILYFAAHRLPLALSAPRQLSAPLDRLQHLSQVAT